MTGFLIAIGAWVAFMVFAHYATRNANYPRKDRVMRRGRFMDGPGGSQGI